MHTLSHFNNTRAENNGGGATADVDQRLAMQLPLGACMQTRMPFLVAQLQSRKPTFQLTNHLMTI